MSTDGGLFTVDWAGEAISWNQKDKLLVELLEPKLSPTTAMTPEIVNFWPTFSWNDNPWIADAANMPLKASIYSKIKPC